MKRGRVEMFEDFVDLSKCEASDEIKSELDKIRIEAKNIFETNYKHKYVDLVEYKQELNLMCSNIIIENGEIFLILSVND